MDFFKTKEVTKPLGEDQIQNAFDEAESQDNDDRNSQTSFTPQPLNDVYPEFQEANTDPVPNHQILSASPYQWEQNPPLMIPDYNQEYTETEYLMRIATLQREIEALKLEADKGHEKLRFLGDTEEPVLFKKELLGAKRWAIEGMSPPHYTDANIHCLEKDSVEISIRDCHGEIRYAAEFPVNVKVTGTCTNIIVSRCKVLTLSIESCSLELRLIKCENITVVCGGHPPRIVAEDTHKVTVLLCFQLMIESIEQVRCSGIVVHSCDRDGKP